MNINGFKKSNNCCFKKNNCNFCNQNNCNNCINSLFEVENFLCNFRKVCKCMNLYKFLK